MFNAVSRIKTCKQNERINSAVTAFFNEIGHSAKQKSERTRMAKAQARSAAASAKNTAAGKSADDTEPTEAVADGPVLDLSNAAVKRM
ncbi:MAG: hypothetical protein AAFW74_11975, partial [Pseudomonadota bacterium]